jgi:hypothetical protein
MTPPTILLRGPELLRAVRCLPPQEIALLVSLLVRAEPTTGRLSCSHEELAIELGTRLASLDHSIARLAHFDFLERIALHGDIELIELGSILHRRGFAPPNLPIESL